MALLATNAINIQRTAAVIQPLSVTENGTYRPSSGVDGFGPVTVNVEGGGGVDWLTIVNGVPCIIYDDGED